MKIYLFLLIQLFSFSSFATETSNEDIKVYRDPNCQCCHKWISHLEENKFNVLDILTPDMASVKEAVHLPKQMTSCHTAIIEGYVIEGHVPAADIRRLLAERPDIAGLSVPQMPVGTPGMEMGERKDNFNVFQFNKEGKYSIFTSYQLDENNAYQTDQHTSAEHQ
tara:strand:+ start:38799 stop:39293 length:495 start_codon:yes stop_codon:yes gene_type:complete